MLRVDHPLWQWDSGRALSVVENGIAVHAVDFFCEEDDEPLRVLVNRDELTAGIPNIYLMRSGDFTAYEVDVNNETIRSYRFTIRPRPRPVDYVYVETEVVRLHDLLAAVNQGAFSAGASKESAAASSSAASDSASSAAQSAQYAAENADVVRQAIEDMTEPLKLAAMSNAEIDEVISEVDAE